jgi:hypothetical protein
MTNGNHRPGGGIKSRVNVETKVRTGQQKKRAIPAGVAQLGQRQGNHVMGKADRLRYGGVEMFGGTGVKLELGNAVALNVGKGGCGTGRTLHGQAGSQGCHGTPDAGNPMPKADLLVRIAQVRQQLFEIERALREVGGDKAHGRLVADFLKRVKNSKRE